ncbi:MAG: hypothetical protein GXY92_07070 [Syntrophomonadaceae bacterium]|nr:hypothetical protein [Syntrophomonadaceae bacterium]
MYKKIIVVLISILMVLTLASCGVREKVNEKIFEKVTETVINKATGGAADIDLDGDKLTIKGEDGEELTIGGSEWPDSGAATMIPEFKHGKVVSAFNSDASCAIVLEEVQEQDFKDYLDELKGLGYTENSYTFSQETAQTYSAEAEDGSAISVTYNGNDQTLTISFRAASTEAEQE